MRNNSKTIKPELLQLTHETLFLTKRGLKIKHGTSFKVIKNKTQTLNTSVWWPVRYWVISLIYSCLELLGAV